MGDTPSLRPLKILWFLIFCWTLPLMTSRVNIILTNVFKLNTFALKSINLYIHDSLNVNTMMLKDVGSKVPVTIVILFTLWVLINYELTQFNSDKWVISLKFFVISILFIGNLYLQGKLSELQFLAEHFLPIIGGPTGFQRKKLRTCLSSEGVCLSTRYDG